MISRLTAIAAAFAAFATVSLAAAGGLHQDTSAAKPVRVVQLEPVVIVAKRLPPAAR